MKDFRAHSLSILFAFFCIVLINAQSDSVLLTKNFKFNDGLFVHYEDFKQNSPTYTWEELDFGLFPNPQTFITRVEYIKTRDGKSIDLNTVWGLSIDGIPHIRLEKGKISEELFVFVSIKVRGKLNYFTYSEEESRMVTIKAYNPLNKQPFRSGQVEQQVDVVYEKIFDLETGTIRDFTVEEFIQLIKEDDPQLVKTIRSLTAEEAREKLFKCLLIYVDRQDVYTNK